MMIDSLYIVLNKNWEQRSDLFPKWSTRVFTWPNFKWRKIQTITKTKKRLKERRKIGTRPPKSEHKFEAFVFLRPPPLWNDDHMKKKYRYRVTYVSFQMIFFKAFKYLGSFGIDVCLGWFLGASAMSEFFLYIISTIQKKYFCLCFLEYNNFWSLTEKKCFLKFRA